MARVGKTVDFDGSRNTINDALIKGINKFSIVGVNWSFVDDDTMNIYGELADLTTLKVEANARGFTFDIIGDAPAETTGPAPLPIPVGTPLDNPIWKQAWNEIREEDRQAILTRVNSRYDSLGGTRQT